MVNERETYQQNEVGAEQRKRPSTSREQKQERMQEHPVGVV
jgi:hypothetical protein